MNNKEDMPESNVSKSKDDRKTQIADLLGKLGQVLNHYPDDEQLMKMGKDFLKHYYPNEDAGVDGSSK